MGDAKMENEIKKIVPFLLSEKDPTKYSTYCDKIRKYVETIKGKVTTTQVRNIFNRVRKIKEPVELQRLRPVLAYVGARNKITFFTNLLEELIREAKEQDGVENFKEFLKIVVAYRKSFE